MANGGYDSFVSRLDPLRKKAPNGSDYWMARDIQPILGYLHWEGFKYVIEKARIACESAGVPADNQFRQAPKMVTIGSGAQREMDDWFLSRYACYLIAMNGDSSKPEIAHAMTYFAIQTRMQERHSQLSAEQKRLLLRDRVKTANKNLNAAAKTAGVQRYGIFHDAGYKGLYGGLGQADLKAQKGIPEKENLLDCIDRAELAANEFRITQTEQKLTRERIMGERQATETHREVGQQVRKAIAKIGGTMPENLPAVPSIKKLAAKVPKRDKAVPEPK